MTFAALDRDECPHCFKYRGWTGEQTRLNPLRAHLACECPSDAELDAEQLTEVRGDPMRKPRRAA